MTLTHSEQLNEIGPALAKAQGEIENAAKNKQNPHFRSNYTDLAGTWDAVREPLSKHGIAVIQSPCSDGARIGVETLLIHSSGQWIRGLLTVTAKDEGPQAAGSCITYLRRYMLQSFAGVAPEDDDGNAAEGREKANGQRVEHKALPPAGYDDWLNDLASVADEGSAKLQETWSKSRLDYRRHLTDTNPTGWDKLKKLAESRPKKAVAS